MFPPGAQTKRINFAPITAREADGIESALRSDPDVLAIAARFGRSETTVRKIAERRGVRGVGRRPTATSRVSDTNNLSQISTVLSSGIEGRKVAETDERGA